MGLEEELIQFYMLSSALEPFDRHGLVQSFSDGKAKDAHWLYQAYVE